MVASSVLYCTEWTLKHVFGPTPPAIQIHSYAGMKKKWFTEKGGQIHPTYSPVQFSKHRIGPRMAFLGGSSVHGGSPEVGFDGEFPSLVEKKLKVPSFNLAHPGLDSHDIQKIVEELQHYAFDAWIIYSGHNDFGNLYFFKRFNGWKRVGKAHLQQFLTQMRLYYFIRKWMLPHANQLRTGFPRGDLRQEIVPDTQKRIALYYFKKNFRRIAWLAKKSNTKLLWVLPSAALEIEPAEYCPPAEPPCIRMDFIQAQTLISSNPTKAAIQLQDISDRDGIPLRMPSWARREIIALAEELHVEYLNSHQALPRESLMKIPSKELFHDHVHFSQKGHKEIAKIIAQRLEK